MAPILPALLLAGGLLAGATPAPRPAPPPASLPAADPTIPFELFRLTNGLTVILHVDHTAPLVAVHVQYDVGSKDEKPGRTGFAHLFEHLMFQGTVHLPKGEDDRLLEAAGGEQNGSTSQDTTVYWQTAPVNALEQLLFSQSERMGFLLPALDQAKLDNQRDVVRNERRERYEMTPYGEAFLKLGEALWAPDFPYHWQPIGSHEDLQAATLADVKEFFDRWYGPNNAVLVVAGDIDPTATRALVEKWFGGLPGAGRRPEHARPSPQPLQAERRAVLEDRVQLPRAYVAWQSPPELGPGDAELDLAGQILSDGKSARLVKRLVMDERIAQSVMAGQMGGRLAGTFLVVATPKPGVPVEHLLAEIDEELAKLAATPPTEAELQRAKNKIESGAVFGLEPLGGFGGRAATLAGYYLKTGDPGYLAKDLARYRAATPAAVSEALRRVVRADGRVVLTVVPREEKGAPVPRPQAQAPAPAPAPAASK